MDERTRRKLQMKFNQLMSRIKRLRLIVIILSVLLSISLIGNGILGYMVINNQNKPVDEDSLSVDDEEDEDEVQNNQDRQTIQKIVEASDWLVTVWNEGINVVGSYLLTGASSTGETVEIETVLTSLESLYTKKDTHNTVITNLHTSEYDSLKIAWRNAIEQLEIIYPEIIATTPEPNAEVGYMENIELFQTYMAEVYNFTNKLEQ